jgi:hypothetical protein
MTPVRGLHFNPLALSYFYPCAGDPTAGENQGVHAVATNDRQLEITIKWCRRNWLPILIAISWSAIHCRPLAMQLKGCNVMGER